MLQYRGFNSPGENFVTPSKFSSLPPTFFPPIRYFIFFILVAKRLEKECGIVRLSIGEALRKVMSTHAHTKLVQQIEEYLLNGFPLPDELAIEALQLYLMDPVCHTRGFVSKPSFFFPLVTPHPRVADP